MRELEALDDGVRAALALGFDAVGGGEAVALLDKEGEADDEGDRCDDGVGRLLLDAEGHPEVLLLPLALP